MLSQDKNKIAYFAALAIFCGSLELFIPKPLPFFRLGLANIPIILSLPLPFSSFMAIALLKGIGNSYVSGNLFSIFGLISITQSLTSALAMYGIKRLLKTHISNYGVSMIGAIVSNITQILLIALYLGYEIVTLLPIMLLFSLFSSIFVAFISYRVPFPENVPEITIDNTSSYYSKTPIITLGISGFSVMATDKISFTVIAFILALIFQNLAGRKIKPLPYITIILILILTSILTPRGKVILQLGAFAITDGALKTALENGFRLSAGIALSQGYSRLIHAGNGIIGRTLAYFTALISSFREIEGNSITDKAKQLLQMKSMTGKKQETKKVSNTILYLSSILFFSLSILSRIYP